MGYVLMSDLYPDMAGTMIANDNTRKALDQGALGLLARANSDPVGTLRGLISTIDAFRVQVERYQAWSENTFPCWTCYGSSTMVKNNAYAAKNNALRRLGDTGRTVIGSSAPTSLITETVANTPGAVVDRAEEIRRGEIMTTEQRRVLTGVGVPSSVLPPAQRSSVDQENEARERERLAQERERARLAQEEADRRDAAERSRLAAAAAAARTQAERDAATRAQREAAARVQRDAAARAQAQAQRDAAARAQAQRDATARPTFAQDVQFNVQTPTFSPVQQAPAVDYFGSVGATLRASTEASARRMAEDAARRREAAAGRVPVQTTAPQLVRPTAPGMSQTTILLLAGGGVILVGGVLLLVVMSGRQAPQYAPPTMPPQGYGQPPGYYPPAANPRRRR